MNDIREDEHQGARARAPRAGDERAVRPGLRVVTWLGVLLVVGAAFLLTVPFQTPHSTEAGDSGLLQVDQTALLAAVVLGCTGIVLVAIRVAAGAVIRSLEESAVGPVK